MNYIRAFWKDRVVQFANRYKKSGETSTQVTLERDPGVVTEAGTPVNAVALNRIEQGIVDAHTTADAALPRSGGIMTGQLRAMKSSGAIGKQAGSVNGFEISSTGVGNAAFQLFHREGAHAAFFGLDIDNKWKIGGYSMGDVAYEMWHDGRLRLDANGLPEYFYEGVWRKLGTPSIVPSGNVKHSFPTEYTSGISTFPLVGKFIPQGIGEVTITADISGTQFNDSEGTTYISGVLWVYNPVALASYENDWFLPNFTAVAGPNWNTPLASNLGQQPERVWTAFLSKQGNNYQTVSTTLRVGSKTPVYLAFSGGGYVNSKIKNITISYDII